MLHIASFDYLHELSRHWLFLLPEARAAAALAAGVTVAALVRRVVARAS